MIEPSRRSHHADTALMVPTTPATVSAAAELDRCLALACRNPDGFERAAARWLASWCVQIPGLSLAEACDAMEALRGLACAHSAVDGARLLKELAGRHRSSDVVLVLDRWLAERLR